MLFLFIGLIHNEYRVQHCFSVLDIVYLWHEHILACCLRVLYIMLVCDVCVMEYLQ